MASHDGHMDPCIHNPGGGVCVASTTPAASQHYCVEASADVLTAAFCGPRVIGSLASLEPLPPQISTPPVNAASESVAKVVNMMPSCLYCLTSVWLIEQAFSSRKHAAELHATATRHRGHSSSSSSFNRRYRVSKQLRQLTECQK